MVSKRKRPPDDDSDFEDFTPRLSSLRRRHQTPRDESDSDFEVFTPRLARLRLCVQKPPPAQKSGQESEQEVVPPRSLPVEDIAKDPARQTVTWTTLKRRLRDAIGLIRALLFIQIEEERVCLKLSCFLQFNQRIVPWMALLKSETVLETTLQAALQDLQSCMPASSKEDLNELELQAALSTILAHLLHGDAAEFRPLVDKLPAEALQTMERLLGAEYRQELSRDGALRDVAGLRSWFALRKRTPERLIDRSLPELQAFPHVPDWAVDEGDHSARRDAYKNKSTRAEESMALTVRRRRLKKNTRNDKIRTRGRPTTNKRTNES